MSKPWQLRYFIGDEPASEACADVDRAEFSRHGVYDRVVVPVKDGTSRSLLSLLERAYEAGRQAKADEIRHAVFNTRPVP
ncbi:hypothetical protein [Inquilinus limosus]|uniref:hypothetical protein n=1 Tax=Inquilinus limosus TaxID=171674 RepID=UPI00126A3108|nr:hypothetical protein [Inquilinus limosus]